MNMRVSDDILGPTNLIAPWRGGPAARAAARKAGIAREAAKLRATYIAAGLPVPPALIEPDPVAPPPPFVPFRIKRHEATGRSQGRPPSAARADAIAAGRKTYMGRPCRHGHSGLRFCVQSICVECARLRRGARKYLRGTWHSTEAADRSH
jgi:hypothetical protein